MCGNSKSENENVQGVNINLNYIKEDVNSALSYASKIGDAELTKQLTEIKDKAVKVGEYVATKTDSHKG